MQWEMMDNDSHSALVEFDTNYWNLVERSLAVPQSKPCVEPATSTARPQGTCPRTAEQFLSKFEAIEKAFREEFISTSSGSTSTNNSSVGGRPAQVIAGLEWPLCHCAMAQAPPPFFDEHRHPPSKKWNVLRALSPWKCCKVFCALVVVTVKTRVRPKKVVTFYIPEFVPPG